ncbi:bifunctional 3'-5' exonuclease/DNA polymerase [Galbitalea sp. SE-J8]|uniref:bifunctional 3'-5' exonuclease/DNA polymerase n=1 Tax=Galbitalea sp. SE-J8 TaxID=3054952 RepID=UPI00259C881A|nr:bifunctional 3'-5' exonuclease/DNA polymerase [Galbitalea sp. SE-J8]MDM4761939.1 bifunctional 3'-5' exonuclease/DNA polymerase [Galbitalea sp. SE-J8]
MFIVLARTAAGVVARRLADDGADEGTDAVADPAAYVAQFEPRRPRWVWDDTRRWYPALLAAGVRVERCVDLRLSHAILRASRLTARSELARAAPGPWDALPAEPEPSVPRSDRGEALFALDEPAVDPAPDLDPVAEWRLQRAAVAGSGESGRLGLLLAAESAGALVACELHHTGLPFDVERHDATLTELLGPRPTGTQRPARLEALKGAIDEALGFAVNPDSAVELLRGLQRAGIRVESTRSWELKRIEHPVIAPLLEYKKRSRLLTANGWRWSDEWVADGRFRAVYVPGGVVTGRWAASGGGALQLPKEVRGAVVADPGWALVVADAAQLEPRVLAAMSGDAGLARAGRSDLYEGMVASGAVDTRAHAKVAMLGAMYGATTGRSGALLPGLARAYPRAMRLVDDAARAGERGETVSTLLGRTSPPPGDEWLAVQRRAGADAASDARARSWARSQGRFTRNFIVQGTAAEWALSWMGILRGRLWERGAGSLDERPHLVFFLHDEVVVHAPENDVEGVLADVRDAAVAAGRLLFGEAPVDFPVTAVAVRSYADAK